MLPVHLNGDDQTFHLGRYSVAYTLGNVVIWQRSYLPQQYVSFEYGYFSIFQLTLKCYYLKSLISPRTSDSGNWNHSVSLPIILIKIKVDQMLPSSYISLMLVPIL